MKIEINREYGFVLKDVFTGVMFETEEGEQLGVCMRDGGFEISVIPLERLRMLPLMFIR